MLYKHMILDDVGVTKKIWSDYILVTFWLHIMVYGYTESDVIAESRGWNAMSGDNDVVCVLWICVVVGTESYVCDQLPKLPEEPPPIGDCINYRYNDGFEKEQAFRLVGCHGMSKDHNGPDEVWNFLPGCGNCNGQVSTKDHYGWIELRCSQLSPPCPVTAEFRHRSAEFNFAKRNYLQSLKKLPSQEF